MEDANNASSNVIHWGSPVPFFGDLKTSKIATLGINPSNREFVDNDGNELDGEQRRFHTLKSLGINKWSDIKKHHINLISDSYRKYFYKNPYDRWFRELDDILLGVGASYYCDAVSACHLDLVPYATENKWSGLTNKQRRNLMDLSKDNLGQLLKNSPVRLLDS